jgi:hypothetical protein
MADHIRTIDQMLQAKPSNMRSLLRLASWAGAAAAALMLAVLSAGIGSKDMGSKGVPATPPIGGDMTRDMTRDMARDMARSSPQVPAATVQLMPRPSEAEKATRQLSEAVSGLTADRDRLVARIAKIERNLEDVTGSIKQQAASSSAPANAATNSATPPATTPAPAAAPPPPPRNQSQPEPPQATPATPAAPPGAIAPAPSNPALARVASTATEPEPGKSEPGKSEPAKSEPGKSRIVDFAIDIGGATTFDGLRALWNSVRGATADLFEDLHPMVAARENKSRGVDLRLIVGPIASTEAATQMCATLLAARRHCQMTIFEGQPLPQTALELERRPPPAAPTRTTPSGQPKSMRPLTPPAPRP